MVTIKDCLKKKNTCIMALIVIHENNGGNEKKVYRVLSRVFNYLIDSYVCIEYLSCKSKTLISISSKPRFEETSFNIILGIGIQELLLNLVSCHCFTKKPNSTVILNFRSRLVNNYLAKVFYIVEKDSNQSILLPNDVKLIINLINQMDTDFFIKKKQSNFIRTKHHQKITYTEKYAFDLQTRQL